MAKFLAEAGAKVVAVSDSAGGIHNEKGFRYDTLVDAKQKKGSVTAAKGDSISNEELLELPVDILVPAALEGVITRKNASKIKATHRRGGGQRARRRRTRTTSSAERASS